MTIAETVAHFARYAADKDALLRTDPLAFALSAMKAGAHVGIGIILIITLGQTAKAIIRRSRSAALGRWCRRRHPRPLRRPCRCAGVHDLGGDRVFRHAGFGYPAAGL